MSQQMGIYRITNRVSGRIYIGSSVDVMERIGAHFSHLRRGRHINGHLQRSFNLYGEAAFESTIVEYVDDIAMLIEREQFWLDSFESSLLYNISLVAGKSPGMKGKTHTDEVKAKLSLLRKGSVNSPETRAKLSIINTGKTHTPETRKKMSVAKTGYSPSAEHRASLSRAGKGRVFSDETREKISRAQIGKIISPEARAKLSIAGKGRVSEKRKAVRQIDPITGETVAIFPSIISASLAIGRKSNGNVSAVCRGKEKTAGGYRWEYVK